MADLTRTGDAIEGGSVEGHSRKPLIARTPRRVNGRMCSIWTAFFDVKAWATKDLAAGAERLVPTASTSLEDRVVCARATVLSTKDRISKEVAHRSASHNANAWNLPQQTAVVIDGPHQEIADAAMARS